MTTDPRLIDTHTLARLARFATEYAYQHPRCPKHHREWRTLAKCEHPDAGTVTGEGPFAVVSCSGFTVSLWPSYDAAASCASALDETRCGHRCERRHRVERLIGRGAA